MRRKTSKRGRFVAYEVQTDLYHGHPEPLYRAGDRLTFDLYRWPRDGEPVLASIVSGPGRGETHLAVFRTCPFTSRHWLLLEGDRPRPVGLLSDTMVIEGTLCRHVRRDPEPEPDRADKPNQDGLRFAGFSPDPYLLDRIERGGRGWARRNGR